MEQSTKAVGTEPNTQEPVGESTALTPAAPPTLPATNFTKVDNNLTGIGFFTASSKRSRKAIEKITVVMDSGIPRKVSIIPSAKYGLPITQDQDFWLALMKLAAEHLQREGVLTNPLTFTTAELLHILGQSDAGKNYKAVQEWLSVMKFTGVEGGAYHTVKKKFLTDRVGVIERATTVGELLDDGGIADKNFVWFSQWQLDNINAGNLIAVELTTYTQLETNIARNLVPHLQEWLFASQRDGRFEKQYEDICQLLGIRVYKFRSDIERKLGPSLDELTTHGYLSKWAIEPMADRKHYKIVLWHGHKYHTDRQARLERNPRTKAQQPKQLPAAGERVQTSQPRPPRQKPLNLQPEVDAQLLSALTSRGVVENIARQELASLPADYPIQDVIEWFDEQISRTGHTLKNAPGFLISFIHNRSRPPGTFTPSRQRKAQEEAAAAKQQAIQEAEAAEDRRRAEQEAQLDRIKTQEPDRYRALYDQAKAELLTDYPNLAAIFKTHPDSSIHDGAIRARIRQLIQTEKPHQTTEPAPRQADRLEVSEPAPAPLTLDIQAILTTLQLAPPATPAEEEPPIEPHLL